MDNKSFALLALLLLFSIQLNAQWTNGQSATYVIGQSSFATNSAGLSSTSLSQPYGVAVDRTNAKLYIADHSNSRILRYSLPITSNQPTAELVFGQASMSSGLANSGGVNKNTLSSPARICVDNSGRLWVADANNNRVVWYNNAYSIASNGANADGVLGQNIYSSGFVSGTSATNMNGPVAVAVHSSGSLFVACIGQNRILRFDNAATLSPGSVADAVIGQPDFISSTPGTTSTSLNSVNTLCISGNSLWVSDAGNNRVLRYDNANTVSNGPSANAVLGQTNYTSAGPGTSATAIFGSGGVGSSGSMLYVAEVTNNRVLIFNNAASKSNGASADFVLGQPDFISNASGTTASTLSGPRGNVDYFIDQFFVSDAGNNRVLVYTASTPLPAVLLSFKAQKEKNGVNLNWVTANEKKLSHYTLQHSMDGIHFQELVQISPGTTTYSNTYNYYDSKCVNGINYYRLIEYDEGTLEEEVLAIASIDYNEEELQIQAQIYPIPSKGIVHLEYYSKEKKIDTYKIFDTEGKEVLHQEMQTKIGVNSVEINIVHFPTNEYLLYFENGNILKLIKE